MFVVSTKSLSFGEIIEMDRAAEKYKLLAEESTKTKTHRFLQDEAFACEHKKAGNKT